MQGQPAQLLAAETLRATGRLRLAVGGSSMLPALRPSDVLLVRRCGIDAPAVGDVVLFLRDGRLFAHRVVGRRGHSLVTRGDAVATPDAPVDASELLGRVTRVVRAGRALRVRSSLSLRGRFAAAIFRHCAPAGRAFTRWQGWRARGAA